MELPLFHNKKELFAHLVKNKALLIAQKKSATKFCDVVSAPVSLYHELGEKDGDAHKAAASGTEITGDILYVASVINTTHIMDSHKDVHLNGLWKKSLQERKHLYLLKEHNMSYDSVISDEVKAKVEKRTWKDLGYNADGDTEALIFYATISKAADNPYQAAKQMFEFYRAKKVKNHSVGMQYVTLDLAINDDDYKAENAVWKKHIDKIVNRKEVEDGGYFWAVSEAKVLEGSAVLIGSNTVTPTLAVEEKHEQTDIHHEPPTGTQVKVNLKKITSNLSL